MEFVVGTVGEQYYETTFPCFWVAGPVVLAGDEEGQVPFGADDAIALEIVRPDGTRAFWSFDFSAQCTVITFSEPIDVSAYFEPGINQVTIRLRDACGTAEGNASLYFSTSGALSQESEAPAGSGGTPDQPVGNVGSRRRDPLLT
jgi:hypothetical protein